MGCLVGLMCYFFDMKIISLLEKKRIHPDFSDPEVNDVDIYKFDPSDFPGLSESNSNEQGWYFFRERTFKYPTSKLVNRKTPGGYWKITGAGSDLWNKSGQVIGSKKILVFYSSNGVKTDWIMHEFYVKDKNDPRYKKDFVLCFIERKPENLNNEKKKSNKSALSTPDDGQPRNSLSSVSISQVAESPYIEVKSKKRKSSRSTYQKKKSNKSAFSTPDDGQPRNSLSSVSISQVAESPYIEVRSSMCCGHINVVETYQELLLLYLWVLVQVKSQQPSSSHRLSSDPGENITEISFSEVELQLLQTANLARDPESLVRESTTSLVELQLPVNNNSCPMQVDPQLLDELDSANSCYRWNQSPLPALQLPINPDHNEGFDPSTDSTGFKDGYNVSGFQFDAISLRDFENFHPCEVTEHSPVCEDIETISKTQWTVNHIDDELGDAISLWDFENLHPCEVTEHSPVCEDIETISKTQWTVNHIDDELGDAISLWDFENLHPCEVTEHSPVCEDIETISKTQWTVNHIDDELGDAISLWDFENLHPCEVTEHSPVCEDIETISKTQWTVNHIDDELGDAISLWDFENLHPCEVTEHSPVCEDIETISKTPVDCKPH
ncbi:uncharacterized protein LOC123203999 isoform X2 [Mangifera indica]|uniref:uncharacterized protein LOC123203999 isoform X2 n=1 Tax=Mangifera indica TaxID=29780 RepID=UPI001CF98997|nr:uncharacterized protein LOC123203999 isoform X2 [Mangifera indica]